MKNKKKIYFRLNLISIFFVAVSFISVTLAWFVYSGLSTVSTEVNVKAWYIELEKDGKTVSNDVVISVDDIYPGMKTVEEEIKLKNLGDSDAQVKYEIVSARILSDESDNYVINDTITSEYVEDNLAHEYPFHINIDLSKKFILAGTDESTFKVSISWPLDSGNDELDSSWGNKAYQFKNTEKENKELDSKYQIRAAIKLDIKLTAEQYIETDTSSDIKYRLGNEILFDPVNNVICTEASSNCIRTNVIDVNNTLSDTKVTLMPKISSITSTATFNDINTGYTNQTSTWSATTRLLNANDILNVVSKDISNSVLSRNGVSDLVIGNLKYPGRNNKVLTLATNRYIVKEGDDLDKIADEYNTTVNELMRINNLTSTTVSVGQTLKISTIDDGYFKYLNKFTYFYSDSCYWLNTEYNPEKAFAANVFDQNQMQIYGENKTVSCKVIPVFIANKIK